MCIGCHEIPGYKTAFPAVYSVPMILVGLWILHGAAKRTPSHADVQRPG